MRSTERPNERMKDQTTEQPNEWMNDRTTNWATWPTWPEQLNERMKDRTTWLTWIEQLNWLAEWPRTVLYWTWPCLREERRSWPISKVNTITNTIPTKSTIVVWFRGIWSQYWLSILKNLTLNFWKFVCILCEKCVYLHL